MAVLWHTATDGQKIAAQDIIHISYIYCKKLACFLWLCFLV